MTLFWIYIILTLFCIKLFCTALMLGVGYILVYLLFDVVCWCWGIISFSVVAWNHWFYDKYIYYGMVQLILCWVIALLFRGLFIMILCSMVYGTISCNQHNELRQCPSLIIEWHFLYSLLDTLICSSFPLFN